MKNTKIRIAAALCLCAVSASAIALPSFARVVSGSATFLIAGDSLTVQTTADTAIEWNTFDIGASEHLYFNQPHSSNWVWNTVLNTAPTRIAGSITSNGGVSLQATAIVFENGALFQGYALALTTTNTLEMDGDVTVIVDTSILIPRTIELPADGGRIISVVPEPETYALLLSGLGVLGGVARRRRT